MKSLARLSVLGAAFAILLAACTESMSTWGTDPALSVSATRSDILVNESATVMIKSQNTLGSNPKVKWSTTLGEITPIKEGMFDFRADKPAAMFTSDKPGTAIVTATLTMDNGKTLSDSTQIQVAAMRQ